MKRQTTKVNVIYHPVQAYTTAAPEIEYKPLSATFVRGEWYYHVTNTPLTPLIGLLRRFLLRSLVHRLFNKRSETLKKKTGCTTLACIQTRPTL